MAHPMPQIMESRFSWPFLCSSVNFKYLCLQERTISRLVLLQRYLDVCLCVCPSQSREAQICTLPFCPTSAHEGLTEKASIGLLKTQWALSGDSKQWAR